jgi:hypothetical protein
LDLDGIVFHFRINNYRKSTKNWEDEWSRVDVGVQADKWLDYHINSQEILLMCEIEELQKKIRALLNRESENDEYIECIEPDLAFYLHADKNRKNSEYGYKLYISGNVDMSLEIAFWNDGLTANRLVLYFGESDLKILLCYLDLITGKIKEEDEEVQDLIKQGFMY